MTQTTTYKLPQWEKADRIVMEDFNGMAAKLETALTAHDTAIADLNSGKADKSTTTNLQTQVNKKADKTVTDALQTQINGKSTFRWGTYAGNGVMGRRIELGFEPGFVMIFCCGTSESTDNDYHVEHAFITPLGALYRHTNSGGMSCHPEMGISGTAISLGADYPYYLNKPVRTYMYIAFKK